MGVLPSAKSHIHPVNGVLQYLNKSKTALIYHTIVSLGTLMDKNSAQINS